MKKVTVKELKEQAQAVRIKGYSRMTKSELEAAIKKAESRRYVAEQREKKGSQWQPETSEEFNRALYGCETYGEVDSLVSDKVTSELNREHRKSQAPEYSRTEYVKFFAGLKGLRVEAESDPSEPRKDAKAMTPITEKGYFEVLSEVDLGTSVNERVRMYKGVYEKLSKLDNWHPETEAEASLLLGFKARNEHSDSFGVYICNDLNVIEVRDRDEAKKLFLELSCEQFRKEYAYAYTELLKDKTVIEIREAGALKGIKLRSRLRKKELIEELKVHLRNEALKSQEEDETQAYNEDARRAYKDDLTTHVDCEESDLPDEGSKTQAAKVYRHYSKVLTMRRRTTLQIVECLKTARNHAERLELLRSAGIRQLKKIGKIESMAEFGRGWTVETLSERILAQLESRYAKIDGGATVYMCGIFGMPIALETPLLKARREKRERGEELDVIEIEKESAKEEADEGIREFQAGNKYKEQYSGAIATIKHREYDMVSLELNYKGQLMPMQLRAKIVDGTEEIKASLNYTDKKGNWKKLKISLKATEIMTADPKTA